MHFRRHLDSLLMGTVAAIHVSLYCTALASSLAVSPIATLLSTRRSAVQNHQFQCSSKLDLLNVGSNLSLYLHSIEVRSGHARLL